MIHDGKGSAHVHLKEGSWATRWYPVGEGGYFHHKTGEWTTRLSPLGGSLDEPPEEEKEGYYHIKDQGYYNTKWVPIGWKHTKVGRSSSEYFPGDWKHADEPGDYHSLYVPGGHIHADKPGTDHSKYFPGDWEHVETNSQSTTYVPGDWIHLDNDESKTIYLPEGFQHGEKPGPDHTSLFPGDYKHGDIVGMDTTEYFPSDYNHQKSGSKTSGYAYGYHCDRTIFNPQGDHSPTSYLRTPC